MKTKLIVIFLLLLGLFFVAPKHNKVNAQTPSADLNVLETSVDNISFPSSITHAQAATVQNGYKSWISSIQNNSQTPVTNAIVSIISGYTPSLFSAVSYPIIQNIGNLAPGSSQFVNLLSPNPQIPVNYTLGYDSTKTVSPTTIPAGGTKQTVTITLTVIDPRYILQSSGFDIIIAPNEMGSNMPNATLISMSDPTNLDQAEQVTDMPDRFQWQLAGNIQLNKPYTFTAVLSVPNQSSVPFEYQPRIQIGGSTQASICQACAGQTTTVLDPTLDGTIPGSGAVTYSITETNHVWASAHSDTYGMEYQGYLPPDITKPTNKDECKNGGWKKYIYPSFKNQGDCVSFVATKGKNPPDGSK